MRTGLQNFQFFCIRQTLFFRPSANRPMLPKSILYSIFDSHSHFQSTFFHHHGYDRDIPDAGHKLNSQAILTNETLYKHFFYFTLVF